MHRPSFNDQLREALIGPEKSLHRLTRENKASFLKSLEILDEVRLERLIISRLKQVYRAPRRADQEKSKSLLLAAIREQSLQLQHGVVWKFLSVLPRKMTATAFALVLLLPAFLGPLQLFQTSQILPNAKAAYVECSGNVLLNSRICNSGELSTLNSGDTISTGSGSFATVFFNDFALARLNDFSEAIIDNLPLQQIQLIKGGVWLNAQGDIGKQSLKISTPALKAQVPQGSAGVVVNGTVTQLFTTNSALEVQIDNSTGATNLVTLAPDKKLTVHKFRRSAHAAESPLDQNQISWVQDNTTKDEAYLTSIKQKAVDDSIAGVQDLPGSVQNFVSKATQSARTALTWDPKLKFTQNLASLDALFAETLVLLNKGDKTTAESNFEAYRSKFISLVQDSSVSIEIGKSDDRRMQLMQILQKHSQLVSPFAPEDPQYSLKNALQKLAVDVDRQAPDNSDSGQMIADVSLNKLLEAHSAVVDGNVDLAKNMLSDTLALVVQSPSSLSGSPTDLTLLDSIAEKSPQLSALALDIKKIKVDQMRAATPHQDTNEIIGSVITGTAYRQDEQGITDNQTKTSKVVGQAIKEEAPL